MGSRKTHPQTSTSAQNQGKPKKKCNQPSLHTGFIMPVERTGSRLIVLPGLVSMQIDQFKNYFMELSDKSNGKTK